MSESSPYAKWKESLSETDPKFDKLRMGTKSIFISSKKESKSIIPRILNALFSVLSVNSSVNQLIVAAKYIPTMPLVSILLILKELFGFVICLPAAIKSLSRKPSPRAYDLILEPVDFSNKIFDRIKLNFTLKQLLRAAIFAFGCLSNLRAAVSLVIAVRWDISLPLFAQETEIQKLSNIMVLAIDLVVKSKNDSVSVDFWLFKDLFVNVFLLCYSHLGHANLSLQYADWLKDIGDGNIDANGVTLGVESFYRTTMGEKCSEEFVKRITSEKPTDHAEEKLKTE